ncbi:MAG: tetratricopeptide repeat protein [Caldilineae bacterium]|nr:MAG: tetratricopeptide repeat protein [Caldilineae bacterium]
MVDVLAPLVGYDSPAEKLERQDRRSQIAALLGIIGILLACLQFILDTLQLLQFPGVRLARFLPYLAGALLAAAVLLALYLLLRSRSPARKRRAAGLLVLALVAMLAWGGWTAYSRITLASDFVIAVADFDGSRSSMQIDFARRIVENLESQLSDLEEDARIIRTHEVYRDAEAARRRGSALRATLIIWGWYDDAGVSPRVELLQLPSLQQDVSAVRVLLSPLTASQPSASLPDVDLSRYARRPSVMPAMDLFLQRGSEELTAVTEAVLALGFFANQRYEEALVLFDKALAELEPGSGAPVGRESILFQRAMTLYALGRVAEAITDLEEITETEEDLFEAHYNLAIAYAQSCTPIMQLTRAIGQAETATRLRPDDADAWLLLGELYLQEGRASDAVAALELALTFDAGNSLTYSLLTQAYAALQQPQKAAHAQAMAIAAVQEEMAAGKLDEVEGHLRLGDIYMAGDDEDAFGRALAEYQAALDLVPELPAALRGLGNAWSWLGETEKAEAAYRTLAEQTPDDPSSHLLLGILYLRGSDVGAARDELEKAAALGKCDPTPYLLLGGLAVKEGDYETALAQYRQAVTFDSENADAWYLLASSAYQAGHYDEAAWAIDSVLALGAGGVGVHRLAAAIARERGEFDKAAKHYETLLQLAPGETDVYALLGDAYLQLSRWDDAIAAYESYLTAGEDAAAHVSLGIALAQKGEIDAAVEHYRRALSLDPEYAAAYRVLGVALSVQGDLEGAREAYQQALALHPDDAQAYAGLASVDERLGLSEEALAAYRQAVRLNPDDWQSQFRLGELYARAGDLAEAEKAYTAALTSNPGSAEAYFGLGLSAYKQCRLSTAVQALNQAVKLQPDLSTYRGLLAALYEAQGRGADAEAIYAELQQKPESDAYAHLVVADYLARRQRYQEAGREYQRVVEAGSLLPFIAAWAHFGLGSVLYAEEKFLAAQAEFEQAVESYPATPDAQAALGDIRMRLGDAAGAIAAYDRAVEMLPAYARLNPVDLTALQTAYIHVRRALAFEHLRQRDKAQEALDAADAAVQAVLAKVPRSPLGHLALGIVREAQGNADEAEAAYDIAVQCDLVLADVRDLVRANLAALGS